MAEALTGPYLVAASIFVIGGLAKVRRPLPLAQALGAVGLSPDTRVPRALGLTEMAVGLGCIARPSPVSAGLLAAMYLLFAAFLAGVLLLEIPIESCGCLGERRTPPSWPHIGLNLAAAAVAGLAVPVAMPSFPDLIVSLGPAAVGFLVGLVALGYAAYLAAAHLSVLAHVYGSTEVRIVPSSRS